MSLISCSLGTLPLLSSTRIIDRNRILALLFEVGLRNLVERRTAKSTLPEKGAARFK
jgi:hypothetical protein